MRTTILLLILSFSSISLSGQTIFLGAQLGSNFASSVVTTNLPHDISTNSGFIAGIVGEMKLDKDFSVRMEPSYVVKGAEMNTVYFNATYNHLIKLNCLDFPILLQYNILDGAFIPVVFAGPNFSFITKSNDSWVITKIGTYPLNGRRASYDVKDYCNSFDMALEFGCGMEYAWRDNLHFFLNARYCDGLTNLVKKAYNGISGTWKTSDIRLQIGGKYRIL